MAQFGVGTLAGLGVGWLAVWAVNRINLEYPGLYPLLALAFGLVAFGSAAVLGSSSIVFRRGILAFHDATAWLGQIVLFVMLGLLSFPSRLLAVAWEGLLVALVLIVVARPVAVVLSALPFGFRRRELTFLSRVGLKGAVPITLATFPLLAGVARSELIFNAVFFVVLISAITQGWSLALVARWLHLGRPADPAPALSVEINALRAVDSEIVDYTVNPGAAAAGLLIRELARPDGLVLTLVLRGRQVIMPRGATALEPADHVFVALRSRVKPLVDRLFSRPDEELSLPSDLNLLFPATTTLAQLKRFPVLSEPLAPAVAAETLGSRLERATEVGSTGSRFGAVWIRPGPDADVVRVVRATEPVKQLS